MTETKKTLNNKTLKRPNSSIGFDTLLANPKSKPNEQMGSETVNIIRKGKVQFQEEDMCDIKPAFWPSNLDGLHQPQGLDRHMHDQELILREPVDEGLKVRHGPDQEWRFKDMCLKEKDSDFKVMFRDKDKVERYSFRVIDLPKEMAQQYLYTNLCNILMNRSVGQLEPKQINNAGLNQFIPRQGLSNEWVNKIDRMENQRNPQGDKNVKNIYVKKNPDDSKMKNTFGNTTGNFKKNMNKELKSDQKQSKDNFIYLTVQIEQFLKFVDKTIESQKNVKDLMFGAPQFKFALSFQYAKDKKPKKKKAVANTRGKESIKNTGLNENFKKDENVNPRPSYAKKDETYEELEEWQFQVYAENWDDENSKHIRGQHKAQHDINKEIFKKSNIENEDIMDQIQRNGTKMKLKWEVIQGQVNETGDFLPADGF